MIHEPPPCVSSLPWCFTVRSRAFSIFRRILFTPADSHQHTRTWMDMCELFSKSYRLAFSIKDRSVTFRSSSKDSFHCLSVIPGQCMQIIFSLKTARTDSALKLCSPLNLSVEDVHLTTSWSSGVLVLQKCQFNVYHPHMTASAPRATCFSYYCHVVWIPTLIPPERQSSCSPRVCFQSAETNYTQLASRFFPREMMSMEPVLQ